MKRVDNIAAVRGKIHTAGVLRRVTRWDNFTGTEQPCVIPLRRVGRNAGVLLLQLVELILRNHGHRTGWRVVGGLRVLATIPIPDGGSNSFVVVTRHVQPLVLPNVGTISRPGAIWICRDTSVLKPYDRHRVSGRNITKRRQKIGWRRNTCRRAHRIP